LYTNKVHSLRTHSKDMIEIPFIYHVSICLDNTNAKNVRCIKFDDTDQEN